MSLSDDQIEGFRKKFSISSNDGHHYSAKWVISFGTYFIKGRAYVCIGVVNSLPIFGLLIDIILPPSQNIFFVVEPLKTVKFNTKLMSYLVSETMLIQPKLCKLEAMLDYNVYHVTSLKNNHKYIQLKYNLDDLMKLHVRGKNPLFL